VTADVPSALAARAHRAAHPAADRCACPGAGAVLADRGGATVVRHGPLVAKAHAAGTDDGTLATRVALAAHPALDGVLLPPLAAPAEGPGGRPVTLWPYGTPVDPDAPERVPWEAAGALLARLHRVDPGSLERPVPPMRGPVKAAAAVARLRAAGPHPGTAPVLRAWRMLPPWARGEAPAPGAPVLCHGDLHLGQLVRARGAWCLIDVDDMGLGPGTWDLARPAAFFACGVLGSGEWTRFLGAYRAGGGPVVPRDGDPWAALDVAARALGVQTAARALAKAVAAGRPLDDVERAVVDSCARMAEVPLAAEEVAAGAASGAERGAAAQ
jgi:Phosphotransferase enzyme family